MKRELYLGTSTVATNRALYHFVMALMGAESVSIEGMAIYDDNTRFRVMVDGDTLTSLDTHKNADCVRFFTDPLKFPVAILALDVDDMYYLNLTGSVLTDEGGAKHSMVVSIKLRKAVLNLRLHGVPNRGLLLELFPDLKVHDVPEL